MYTHNFENNRYYFIVDSKKNIGGLAPDLKTRNLRFKYPDIKVGYDEFTRFYNPEGWLGRKVIAIPCAIWSGLVKTVYHLAKAILVGFFKALTNEKNYFQAHLFHTARDFQESFGWLISLFNDRLGQYHIQESAFNKLLYSLVLFSGSITITQAQQTVESTNTSGDPTENPDSSPPSRATSSDSIPVAGGSAQPSLQTPTPVEACRELIEKLGNCSTADQVKELFKTNSTPLKLTRELAEAVCNVDPDPRLLLELDPTISNREDSLLIALSCCKTYVQAERFYSPASSHLRCKISVGTALVKIDPACIDMLVYHMKKDNRVILAALQACKSSEKAEIVINQSELTIVYDVDVACALLKIDPAFIEKLAPNLKKIKRVVLAALQACKSSEQAEHVIEQSGLRVIGDVDVAHALVKIDPALIEKLAPNLKNRESVSLAALLACKSSEEVKYVIEQSGLRVIGDVNVATKLVSIDPVFFDRFSYELRNDVSFVKKILKTFKGLKVINVLNSCGLNVICDESMRGLIPRRLGLAHGHDKIEESLLNELRDITTVVWDEPKDLKGKDSDAAHLIREILKWQHALGLSLTRSSLSRDQARIVLCRLLSLEETENNQRLKEEFSIKFKIIADKKEQYGLSGSALKILLVVISCSGIDIQKAT